MKIHPPTVRFSLARVSFGWALGIEVYHDMVYISLGRWDLRATWSHI